MGLLGKILGVVGDSVAKGIGNVVEKAVGEAVKPAAEKFAQKQADLIDQAAKNVEQSAEALKNANEEIAKAGTEAAKEAEKTSPEDLKTALEYLSRNMAAAAQGLKAELEADVEEEAELTQEEFAAKCAEILPDFPAWTVGGKDFYLRETSKADNGTPIYALTASASELVLMAYIAVLKADGFVPKYKGSNSSLYKKVGDRYPAFCVDPNDGIDSDAGQINVYFYEEMEEDIKQAATI